MDRKAVIIIGGPTAVGKTAAAIAVAQHFQTEIISADSRQCYREMSIGVARPSAEELAAVPHHFIASHSVTENVTAATFEQYALEKAAQIFETNNVVVMTGGTGLYLQAFCEGFDPIPDVPETIREKVRQQYALKGLSWLQDEVAKHDPLFFAQGEVANPQRLMRALEVFLATGKSIFTFRTGVKKKRPFNIIKIALELDKETLHQRINRRVEIMMEESQLDEVKKLLPFRHLNALQTVGYRELFAYLDGNIALEAAVQAIQQNTRQYAKRQLTWFRRDGAYQWFHPAATESILAYVHQQLNEQ
ncbi:tRNA (adenosine(37)-N6)-dimethylallyltransferase MiaA [Pseudocnuella soli]|uniref:tRNA (adenosine(37)-N6)-dimethylallyltransferase MiaA n=1 Tax=Pseudocnuella soli TaxID=2502779 RepID=UPI001052BD6C|nr:tRNA (adenosine(37)-N6)-dimethylallyltransferase MiaA [Pseudocnuella soli]